MKEHRFPPVWAAVAIAVVGGLVASLPSRSQIPGAQLTDDSAQVAVSTVVNEHIHGIVFRFGDIDRFLSTLSSDDDSIFLESNPGFDGGAPNGALHSHQVRMTRRDLNTLKATGTVTVISEFSNGHQHAFTFVRKEDCPVIVVPVPAVSPSPVVSPSVSPSPVVSPSVSPSPVVSISPSPEPSGQPSGEPSGQPSGEPSGGPSGGPRPPLTPLSPIAPISPLAPIAPIEPSPEPEPEPSQIPQPPLPPTSPFVPETPFAPLPPSSGFTPFRAEPPSQGR